MKAKDVMTREAVSIDKDERLPTILEMMRKRNISKFPVVERGHLVGVVIDGDVADELGALKNRTVATGQLHASSVMRRNVYTATPDTDVAELLYQMLEQDLAMVPIAHDSTLLGVVTASDLVTRVTSTQPVSAFMSKSLHVVGPTDRVIHARRLMVDNHVERLPVLDAGRIVGIVGELDIALGLWEFRETVSLQHQPAQLRTFTVDQIMQRQVVTAPETTTATDAARIMRENDVGCLPILRGDRLVGIVTRSDLLRLLDL